MAVLWMVYPQPMFYNTSICVTVCVGSCKCNECCQCTSKCIHYCATHSFYLNFVSMQMETKLSWQTSTHVLKFSVHI